MDQNKTLKRQLQLACFSLTLLAWIAAAIGIFTNLSSSPVLAGIEILVLLLSFILPFVFTRMTRKRLFEPLEECAQRLQALSEGDLDSPLPAEDVNAEVGKLVKNTKHIIRTLRTIIQDETRILSAMSEGDFSVCSECRSIYVNGFAPLLESMRKICFRMNSTLHQIQESSNQVDAGAEQVSTGAQALSQGATEQASSIEQLAATINDISSQIKESAANAATASSLAHSVGNDMMDSNLHMSEMTNAMAEIKESATQIHKIIKTIEDIAFQTNILALNAAVEAARAGSAGKGFAVVAEEVRNLAGKSQDAAQDTTVMIQNAISAVEKGTKIADETAESMNKVVANAQLVVDQISSISDTAKAQADAVAQVTTGVDQISSVVQTNSATAQQSAAASEELSGQASLLKNVLSGFTFRQTNEYEKEAGAVADASLSAQTEPSSPVAFAGIGDKY
ncbi:methyl-accepting chemotaxis protein [Mediterraneibacter sp. NSJ-55]|uniref:Methyl-accepting chemotaxis protein n=1 Tax=Mediterraneibacter hominis TaxID=2763054 RepID=A0A923LJB9_9FIRM|nr:methyl-accepting chemotaxis protein [Mediterraneibacter hominis]MBC5689330.1 methyl-accepting chemotaxis protein [Mediterraneibacter hominis]